MWGSDEGTAALFSFVDFEELVPAKHPLLRIHQIVNDAPATLDGEVSKLYASEGRTSIAPEKLQLNYNLLFRWFVGLAVDDPVRLGLDRAPTSQKNHAESPHVTIGAPLSEVPLVALGHRLIKPHPDP